MIFVTTTAEGDEIRYQDTKRYLWLLSVLSPGVPAICAALMLLSGNLAWSLAPFFIYFILVPLLDALIGEDPDNPPDDVINQLSQDQYYRRLLFVAAGVLWLNFLTIAIIIGTVDLPLWAAVALTLSSGIASGSGLTVAHELGHKQNRADRIGARLVAAITGYAHFMIEHNRGHHTQVATPEDAASARLGESVYAFSMREIPTVARRGWQFEVERLRRKGLPVWSWHNELLQGYAINAAVTIVLCVAFGWWMILFLIPHHLMGWYQLTMANYVEHYGLKRQRGDNGRYEPCQPRHSWNTNHIVSNLMLFHLQRHSDHHANPMRPYQSLRNYEELPQLPSGYPGSFALAMVPPLWRKIMDRKVFAWAGGDVDACNVAPSRESAYRQQFQNLS